MALFSPIEFDITLYFVNYYSSLTWPCISRNYYSPGSASLYFGGRSLGVRSMEVVFDSGSSFTYFAAQPYQTLVTAVNFKTFFTCNTTWLLNKHGASEVLLLQLKGELSRTLKEVWPLPASVLEREETIQNCAWCEKGVQVIGFELCQWKEGTHGDPAWKLPHCHCKYSITLWIIGNDRKLLVAKI